MKSSLVTRLTAVVVAISILSIAALALITFRSTSNAFSVEREVLDVVLDEAAVRPILAVLERVGAAGAAEVAAHPENYGLRPDSAFIVVSPQLTVIASTEPAMRNASVSLNREGYLQLVASGNVNGASNQFQLYLRQRFDLRGGDGQVFGELALLPKRMDPLSGNDFAFAIWRNSAIALIAVVLLGVAATAWVLRRSLAPIDALTRAATDLQVGQLPARLDIKGGSIEFDRLIETFNRATEAIATTERTRRALVSDVAHELRTPVTNIRAQLEAANAGLISNDQALLEVLRGEASQLERLVEDFQQLALAESGQLEIFAEDLPLAETLCNIMEPLARAGRFELAIDVADDVHVRADPGRLRQVLGNLTENATRHRSEGLIITLSDLEGSDRVGFVFADNGPGIAPDVGERIFERFYRGESARSQDTGGGGLGLAIARSLMKGMDAMICLLPGTDTEDGDQSANGARFSLLFREARAGA